MTIILHDANNDEILRRTVDIVLIFHEQKVSFGILAKDFYGFLCHLHNGGVTCAVPENLKSHVLWLKQTWNHQKEGKNILKALQNFLKTLVMLS